jgi:hypothetical protein
VSPHRVDLSAAYPPIASTSTSVLSYPLSDKLPPSLFDFGTGFAPPPGTATSTRELAQSLRSAKAQNEAKRTTQRDAKGKGRAVEQDEVPLRFADRDEGYDENAQEEDEPEDEQMEVEEVEKSLLPDEGIAEKKGEEAGPPKQEEGDLPPDKPSLPPKTPPTLDPTPSISIDKRWSTYTDTRPQIRLRRLSSTAPLHAAIPGAVFAFFFLPPKDRTDTSALFPRLQPLQATRSSSPDVLSRQEKTLLKAAAEPVALEKPLEEQRSAQTVTVEEEQVEKDQVEPLAEVEEGEEPKEKVNKVVDPKGVEEDAAMQEESPAPHGTSLGELEDKQMESTGDAEAAGA